MNRPVILGAARIRLGKICGYTAEKWGEEKADRYLRSLGDCIDNLGSEERLWRKLKDKRLEGVFFVRRGHPFIFFREIRGHIAVISILHEKMNIVERLREDMDSGE